MKQYHDLLETILEKGCYKPPARENMPGTQSRFGHQFRHDMADGFPLVTTKKIYLKSVIYELLWFLRGDTNIKFLMDNGVNIWNQDAYNYYVKRFEGTEHYIVPYTDFLHLVKSGETIDDYTFGDCGFQYGRVWRDWPGEFKWEWDNEGGTLHRPSTDQIKKVLNTLMTNPESRRHLVTAIDPAHENELALYWCHAFFQFNCRPITVGKRAKMAGETGHLSEVDMHKYLDQKGIPKYYLDLQLYQRSADVFLGVPFNIASYAMILQIFAEVCNMVPGEFIHTFGDVHIYDNHREQVNEQLTREIRPLPKFSIKPELIEKWRKAKDIVITDDVDLLDFSITGYDPHPAIKAELSTGMKKQ